MKKKTIITALLALVAVAVRGQVMNVTDELLAEYPSNVRAMVENSWRIMQAVKGGNVNDVRPLLAPDLRMGRWTGAEAVEALDSVARLRDMDSLVFLRVMSIGDQAIVEIRAVVGGDGRDISLQGGRDGLVTSIRGLTRHSIYDDPDPLTNVRVLNTFEGVQAITEQDSVTVPFSLHSGCIVLTLQGDGRELTFLFDTGCNLTQLNSVHHRPDDRGLVRLDSLHVGPNIYSMETEAYDLSRMERQLGLPRLDGILGNDFIQYPVHNDMTPVGFGYDLHIDFPRQLLTLYRLDTDGHSPCTLHPREVHPFTLTREGNLPVLTLQANGSDVRMCFDTGCTGYILTPQTLDRLPGELVPADSVTVAHHDQEQIVPSFRLQCIALGSIEAQSPVVQAHSDLRFPEYGFLDIRFFARHRIGLNYVTRQLSIYESQEEPPVADIKPQPATHVHYLDMTDIAPENILQTILDCYKGKTVLIDIWATWCAPSILGHRAMAPLKERLKGDPVQFIYITSPTSPVAHWKDMIQDIPGAHYYVTDEQCKSLLSHYQSGGYPTYAIYDAQGTQTYTCSGFPGVEIIKEELGKTLQNQEQ